jgi:hypothetical protein
MFKLIKRLFRLDGFDSEGGYCYYDVFGNIRNSWGEIIIKRGDCENL